MGKTKSLDATTAMIDAEASAIANAQRHPLWGEQVRIEAEAAALGAAIYQDHVATARSSGAADTTGPERRLISRDLGRTVEHLHDALMHSKRSRGPKPVAMGLLRSPAGTAYGSTAEGTISLDVAVLVAMRTCLKTILARRSGRSSGSLPSVLYVAGQVGLACEREARVRAWADHNPEQYASLRAHLDRSKATSGHRATVNRMFSSRPDVPWNVWTQEERNRLGLYLVDGIAKACGWFSYEREYHGGGTSPTICLAPSEGLTLWLGNAHKAAEIAAADYMPTVIPPKPWLGFRCGGYWTPLVDQPPLVRFKGYTEGQRAAVEAEYDALDMPKVYAAVNALQAKPWRVNRRVLDVVRWAVSLPYPFPALPPAPNFEKSPKPADFEENEEARKEWRKLEAMRIATERSKASKRMRMGETLRIASRFSEYPAIWFPHHLCFRGRAYPLPSTFSPHGDDLCRGLLEAGEARPITEECEGWLAINVATAFGIDKVSYEERIAWVNERRDTWLAIDADPQGTASIWTARGVSPWQALAAVFELAGYYRGGSGYMSRATVWTDGTCNGIQHLSAMTLDEVAGEHVNLLPSDRPRDIYKHVADLLKEDCARIRSAGGEPAVHADFWFNLLGQEDWPRTLTKRQVMVLPYGGTRESFMEYTMEWLLENSPLSEDATKEERKAYWAAGRFLANRMWDVVSAVVRGGVRTMQWLKDVSKAATTTNQPIYWTTPSGFLVRHFYNAQKQGRVRVMLDGTSHLLVSQRPTSDLDVQSQLRGIPPNFVHSFDAAAMHLTANMATERGVSIASIHDAFGAHPADMWALYDCIRQAFVTVHAEPALAMYRSAVAGGVANAALMLGSHDGDPMQAYEASLDRLPLPPESGGLDLKAVLRSDYFFA